MRRGKKSERYAYVLSRNVTAFLKAFHNDKEGNIISDLALILSPQDYHSSTKKADDEEIKYSIKFYYDLFSQITNFLLDEKPYPFYLKLYNNEPYYILPHNKWTKPNCAYFKKVFDFKKGNIKEIDEIKKLYKRKYLPSKKLNEINEKIKFNNTNFDTKERLFLGSIALRAYFMHFLAITGMNDSTAATLPWDSKYEVKNDYQSFKNIKYRAGNKPVEFRLQNKAIKDFKKFLKLRQYLLGSNTIPFLFFNGNRDKCNNGFTHSSGTFSTQINTFAISTIDSQLPRITSRQYRVNKTHYNIKKYGIWVASQLAQSSVSTIIKHYTGETEESSSTQLTQYFNHLNENIIFKKDKGKEISVGHCKNIDNPKSKIKLKEIEISCKQSEGCLFCEHYGCHADEIDIRKLYSLLFVINESKYVAENEEHFLSIYSVIIDRINNILEYIQNNTKLNIKSIKHDVMNNENLHPYWEYKLKCLVDMGVLK